MCTLPADELGFIINGEAVNSGAPDHLSTLPFEEATLLFHRSAAAGAAGAPAKDSGVQDFVLRGTSLHVCGEATRASSLGSLCSMDPGSTSSSLRMFALGEILNESQESCRGELADVPPAVRDTCVALRSLGAAGVRSLGDLGSCGYVCVVREPAAAFSQRARGPFEGLSSIDCGAGACGACIIVIGQDVNC